MNLTDKLCWTFNLTDSFFRYNVLDRQNLATVHLDRQHSDPIQLDRQHSDPTQLDRQESFILTDSNFLNSLPWQTMFTSNPDTYIFCLSNNNFAKSVVCQDKWSAFFVCQIATLQKWCLSRWMVSFYCLSRLDPCLFCLSNSNLGKKGFCQDE